MAKGILGRKVGMTQIYDEKGNAISVTVLQAGPCHILQVRSRDRDGYEAIQLGYLDKVRERANRSERGHVAKISSKRSKSQANAGVVPFEKADCEPKQFVRELRGEAEGYSVGQELKVDQLAEVTAVDVTGTSKGRGFSGVMKRHNFAGQRASHGVKKVHRHAGGTGCSAYPARLFKGKHMAGQYGNTQTTSRNLKVVRVDAENDLLLVRGAVPGPNGGFVVIKETNKLG